MAKKLSDVLAGTNKSRTRPGSTGTRPGVDYASKMEDERNFVVSHEVQEFDDRVGNESDVYNATNIKHAPDKKHGNIPKPEDEKQYKQANEETMTSSPRPVPRPGRTLPSGGYQYPNGAVEPGPGFRPLSTDTGSANTGSEMTSSPRPKPRPAGLSSNSSSNTSMSDTYSTRPKPRPVFAEAKKEYDDATDEKEMMMNQLNFIKLASEKIKGHINSTKDPEEWFQNKLSGIHANMKDLHAYAAGEKEVKEEAEQIDELSNKILGPYAKEAIRNLGNLESEITRNRYVDPAGVKDPIEHNNSLRRQREKRSRFINTAIDKMTKEEAEGDPRVEPKDVKTNNGKPLKMITGQVKESNYNGSRTKTETEQTRAHFAKNFYKNMEREKMQKNQKDQEDDN
jgi:hypothetical protein